MPVQPAAVELLAALAPILARWGRWYVFGAQAVVIHGVPRLSADVDVTLALTPDDPERFASEMQAGGFSLRVTDPGFIRRTRVLWRLHGSARDADGIRSTLRQLEEALGQSDLVPVFEALARSGAR